VKDDKAVEHLINPITFQMMDQEEKMRDQLTKEKKMTDDVINQKTFYTRKLLSS
jgi:hypothetical protein